MLIKLTNAAKGRIGDPLILNTDFIVSLFENLQTDTDTKVTFAYSVSGSTWEVKETLDEISELIKNNQ